MHIVIVLDSSSGDWFDLSDPHNSWSKIDNPLVQNDLPAIADLESKQIYRFVFWQPY